MYRGALHKFSLITPCTGEHYIDSVWSDKGAYPQWAHVWGRACIDSVVSDGSAAATSPEPLLPACAAVCFVNISCTFQMSKPFHWHLHYISSWPWEINFLVNKVTFAAMVQLGQHVSLYTVWCLVTNWILVIVDRVSSCRSLIKCL